jgi:hypothetical protein
MRWMTAIISSAVAGILAVFWLGILFGKHNHSIEVPHSGTARDYIEGRNHTRRHLLLASDTRGFVVDVFTRKLPPEKAPGPPGSDATQQWLGARARQTTAAYARFLGFEKGTQFRHGQIGNETVYFFGTDHYFAVPHPVLVLLSALPGLCIIATSRPEHRTSHTCETSADNARPQS